MRFILNLKKYQIGLGVFKQTFPDYSFLKGKQRKCKTSGVTVFHGWR